MYVNTVRDGQWSEGSLMLRQDEETVKSSYTGIPNSMLRHEYQVGLP